MAARVTASAAQLILRWPRSVLLLLLAVLGLLVARLPQLEVDVSARTLLAADAPELSAWRATVKSFHLHEQVVVTVATPQDIASPTTRGLLDRLQRELSRVAGVAKVTSVLDAPLLHQVPGPLSQLEGNRRSLRSPDVDLAKAREELLASPLFREVLIGRDGRVSALWVELRESPPSAATLAALRKVLEHHAGSARLTLSGESVVADELMRVARADLLCLPLAVLAVMLVLIAAGTRRPPVLEAVCGSYAALATVGGWQLGHAVIGPVPAAALPLVVVIAVSFAFTLRVSYKLHVSLSAGDPHSVLTATVEHALNASLPATGVLLMLAQTLSLSPLLPVHDLGHLLLLGLASAWLAAFGVGPCLLAVARRRPQALAPVPLGVPARWLSVALAAALAVAAVGGLHRFIEESGLESYARADSPLRAALAVVDREFGGALSVDLVISLPAPPPIQARAPLVDDLYRGSVGDGATEDDWFTSTRVQRIKALHGYLEQQPTVGRVLSLASLLEVARRANGGVELSPFEMNLMYRRLPRAVRSALIDPYVMPDRSEARLHLSMHNVPAGLTRATVLARIEHDLTTRFGFGAKEYRLSGPYVVYAHMADLLPPTLVVIGALGALASLALVILCGRTPRAASRMLMPALIAALGVMGVAGWHALHLDVVTVCASGVAFALFVQIRTASRHWVETPAPASLQAGTAPPPVRDPYGSTVMGLGTVSVGAGLATMGAAAFAPAAHFGLLCGATVTLALLASQRVSGLRRRRA